MEDRRVKWGQITVDDGSEVLMLLIFTSCERKMKISSFSMVCMEMCLGMGVEKIKYKVLTGS